MRELNIEFQEQYKRLDKLCKEMYSSNEGVSSYLQDMECTPYSEQYVINNWSAVCKQLKHYRWMRNQLAHDISIDSDFCEQYDIDWIKNFYESILNGTDPLTLANKAKQVTAQKRFTTPKITTEYRPIQVEEPPKKQENGCYIATAVYGSYDCPQVWTLRRYRDNILGATWYGRLFIRIYYAISPTLVKLFGKTKWFNKMWKKRLDKKVSKLNANGVMNTPYIDMDWHK